MVLFNLKIGLVALIWLIGIWAIIFGVALIVLGLQAAEDPLSAPTPERQSRYYNGVDPPARIGAVCFCTHRSRFPPDPAAGPFVR